MPSTLGFIGWYAQGQFLSIVTLLGVVKAARQNFNLWLSAVRSGLAAHLGLRDRDSVCLGPWHVLRLAVSLRRVARLRGPVGPLAWLARIYPNPRLGMVAGAVEILSPAVLVIGTVLDASLAETLAEVEPFKTSITLGFDREWPFVAYAGLLLAAAMVMFKPYCRFLCPLGAALVCGRARPAPELDPQAPGMRHAL